MAGFLKRLLGREAEKTLRCGAVVPAAGSSSRMGGQDKILLPLDGVPVLIRTLRALESSALITEIIVVTREDLIVPISQLCRDAALSKVSKVVIGGSGRAESVLRGIRALPEETELIAIHDGARPLVTTEVIDQAITMAAQRGAAAPAVPVKDTVKKAHDGLVEETPDRSSLFAVQTPQVFDASLIRGALGKAVEENAPITDDCSAVERLGMQVFLTQGDYTNLKITTPEDMAVAEGLLAWRQS